MKIVTHKRLQTYKHHYGMVCLTGLLGCRWHRYQQSQNKSTKNDRIWFTVLVLASLYIVFWLYFWLLAENSLDLFNWYVYQLGNKWQPYYTILFILTCIAFSYVILLMILALCHVGHKHQLFIHGAHKCLLVVVLLGCAVFTVLITELWRECWDLQYTSLMITAPFLHVAAVGLMTLLSWFIAEAWVTLYNKLPRVVVLGLFTGGMCLLYVVPVFVQSPCITAASRLPGRPALVGHRGQAALAPENTMPSFQTAVDENVIAIETDVQISWDGVAFLLHDDTLRRTTDIEAVWPDLAGGPACRLNMGQLEQLDAGSWFLQRDPFGTLSSLDESTKASFRNESVARLSTLLELAAASDIGVLPRITFHQEPRCPDHPNNGTYGDVIMKVINESNISHSQILWLYGDKIPGVDPTEFTAVHDWRGSRNTVDPERLTGTYVTARYGTLSWRDVQVLQAYNLSLNFYVVDSPWLYSLYWCMGAASVTSNRPGALGDMTQPVWAMTPEQFKVMWITADCVSFVIIVVIFVVQKVRRSEKQFHSEKISLQGAKIRMSHLRKNRNMKEKLLHTVESIQEVEPGILGMPAGNGELPAGAQHFQRYPYSTSNGGTQNGGAMATPSPENRLSSVSGVSGISGISAISGTTLGDSSFSGAHSDEDFRDLRLSDIQLEVAT